MIGVRTRERKFATYNYWTVGSVALNYSARQENELYDYSTEGGRLELDNVASSQPLFAQLQQFIQNEILPNHLRRQLPDPYQAVHEDCYSGVYQRNPGTEQYRKELARAGISVRHGFLNNFINRVAHFCIRVTVLFLQNAGWSSLVARQAHNLKAVGSNPTPATNFKSCQMAGFFFVSILFLTTCLRNGDTGKRYDVRSCFLFQI